MLAPRAAQKPYLHQIHGHQRPDPYHWLRDDSRRDPAVLAHLQAENAYTEACLAGNAALEQELVAEMRSRVAPEDVSLPWRDHGWQLRQRTRAEQEYPLIEGRQHQGAWQLLLDINVLAGTRGYFSVGALAVSPDGSLLAFSTDDNGDRCYQPRLLCLQSLTELPCDLPPCSGELIWGHDSKTLHYLALDDSLLPYQLHRQRLGQASECLYEEADNSFWLGLSESRDRQYLLLSCDATLTSEVQLLPLDGSASSPQPFWPRRPGHEYQLDVLDGQFAALSNDQGPNFRLLLGDSPATMVERQGHDPEVLLVDMDLLSGRLALLERHAGQARVRVLTGNRSQLVSWPEPVHDVWLAHSDDPAQLQLGYQSPLTPPSQYRLEADGSTSLLKSKPVPNVTLSNYHCQRVMLPARDGTLVPVTLVWHKARFRAGTNPLLIEGYGAYGISLEPAFSASRLSLLDRGVVLATAHVRGGQEQGRSWYEGGRRQHKWHSFHDFIDVTKGLLAAGFGAAGKVFCEGRSAGGLLVATVLNEAPELYHGALAGVPFVDVVSTMLDDSLPLTTGEYDEWGNPNQPGDYHLMLSYSPYDNVRAQAYPHLYVRAGLHDTQVGYWEPAKWVAKLRECKTDNNLLLLETELATGHGGLSGRYQRLQELAREYAFVLQLAS